MKNLFKVFLMVACVSFVLHSQLAFSKQKAQTGNAQVPPAVSAAQSAISAFQSSREWSKLDEGTQNAWVSAMNAGDLTRRIDCFVRVMEPFDSGDRSFLFSSGYNVRTVGGSVATGYVAAQDLPNVAQQPFVRSIKLSTKSQ